MNEPSVVHPVNSDSHRNWLDAHLPDGQLVPFEPQHRLIDLPAIRGLIFRQRWLIAGVMLSAAIVGLIVTLLATPMYQARSTVRISPYGSFIVEGQNVDQGIAANQVYNLLATQVGIITSRDLAEVVAEDLSLGERYDLLGADIDERRPPNMADADWLDAKQSMAAAILHGSVSSEVPSENWIIPITFRSSDPVIAAEMANAYSDAFVASDTRATVANNEYAIEYLKTQIEKVRDQLGDAEKASNAYARNSGIIVQPSTGPDGTEGSATLTSANLASINARSAAATAERIQAEQRWRSIQSLPASQLPEVQSNPVLQGLISERSSKSAELTSLRQRYNDEFPQIKNVIAQIETLDRQIERSSADIKASVRNAYVVARNQEQALERELNSLTGATLAEQDRQVELSVLEREAQALREQLNSLLARYNQVSSASNAQTGMINPLDSAQVPGSPYSPSLYRNMMLALVLGAAFAGGLAFLRETFDDRIRKLDDIEERLGLTLLGHTPHVDAQDIEYEGAGRFGALMEAYASIRSTIDFVLPRERNVIQLTSSQESEGKSTTAVILAELFASLGQKTLLVDADLRRPSVASLLGVERPKEGLVEVLLGSAELDSAVIKGVHENLEILPVGQIPSNPTEVLGSPRLREFIAKCREEYALVIFDSSPVLGLADAPMLSRLVDGTIFVIEANEVHHGQAKTAIRRLTRGGGHILGAILTKFRAMEAGQSYDYQYRYYKYGERD